MEARRTRSPLELSEWATKSSEDSHLLVPLILLTSLVQLGISLPFLVLSGTGWCDQGIIYDRALVHGHVLPAEVGFDGLKD